MGPGKKVTDDALQRVKPAVKSNADRLKELGAQVDNIQRPKQPAVKK